MQEFFYVTGLVLKQSPVGEYDRRICLLTKEKGKISAFVRGARKPGNRLTAASNPFAFGTFKIYPGKDSYTVSEAEITKYFEEFRTDFVGAYYGMYFAEIADYYTRENNDERELLKLLYQSLRAIASDSIPNPLVKCIYEIKAIVVNGEFPGIPSNWELSASAQYAIQYIQGSSVEKLYTFAVTDEVLKELEEAADFYCHKCMRYDFKSLTILKTLC